MAVVLSKDTGVMGLSENFRLFELVIIILQVSDPLVNNENENSIPFLILGLDHQLQPSRVLIFITFPSLAQARLGELPALRACTVYILVKETQGGPQIIQGRTVTGYAVLFRFFCYKYTQHLYISQVMKLNTLLKIVMHFHLD